MFVNFKLRGCYMLKNLIVLLSVVFFANSPIFASTDKHTNKAAHDEKTEKKHHEVKSEEHTEEKK